MKFYRVWTVARGPNGERHAYDVIVIAVNRPHAEAIAKAEIEQRTGLFVSTHIEKTCEIEPDNARVVAVEAQ